MAKRSVRDWAMLLALVLFWGSSFATTKIAVETISPVWVMALRLCIGAVSLYGLLRWRGRNLTIDRTTIPWFLWLGLVGSVAPFYLISWGSQHIPSGLVGITMGLVPLITLTLAHFLLSDERLTTGKLLGFIAGFVGLAILLGPQLPDGVSFESKALIAQLAIVLATCGYALQLVTARKSPDMPVVEKSTGVILAAAIAGLLLAIITDPYGLSAPSLAGLLASVALGVFPTALAAVLLFRLVDRAGASFVATTNYLLPPFAYALGIASMGEAFQWSALLGLLVILFGIYLAERT